MFIEDSDVLVEVTSGKEGDIPREGNINTIARNAKRRTPRFTPVFLRIFIVVWKTTCPTLKSQ
jgi:hypothetical protein